MKSLDFVLVAVSKGERENLATADVQACIAACIALKEDENYSHTLFSAARHHRTGSVTRNGHGDCAGSRYAFCTARSSYLFICAIDHFHHFIYMISFTENVRAVLGPGP